MAFVSTFTGLASGNGKELFDDVSKLGAIISFVTTSGLNGHAPVFQNAALIFSGVSAFLWALEYIEIKFAFVTFCLFELSN